MDRSWMYQSRLTSEYLNGVEEFLKFAFCNASIEGKIICPCVRCGNGRWVTQSEAVDHLVCDGFIKGYTKWIAHGEALSSRTSTTIPTRMSMEWKTELDKTNKKLEELTQLYSQSSANEVNPSNIPATSPNQHQHVGSSPSISQQLRVKVGDFVYFNSVANPTEIVGKGRIVSLDSSTKVGGEELGANWCEIQVQLPIRWDEHLIRPYGGLKTVGDVIGISIAWPISLVVRDDDGCLLNEVLT